MNHTQVSLFGRKVPMFFFSLLTGMLLAIAWPPLPAGVLLFFSFLPLFYVLDKCETLKQLFLHCFLAFAIWGLFTMYWIGVMLIKVPQESLAYLAFIAIPLAMTVPFLIWKITTRHWNAYTQWLLLPFYWTAYEFMLEKGDLAFGWLNLGLGLSSYPQLIGFYQYTGAIGGSFIIILVNVLLFLGIKYRTDKKNRNLSLIALALVLVGICCGDATHTSSSDLDAKTVRIAAVQANANPYVVLTPHTNFEQFDTLEKMILPLKNQHVNLIICSEGYFRSIRPFILNDIDKDTIVRLLKQLSIQINAPILTGAIVQKVFYTPKPPSPTAIKIRDGMYFDSYNAALLVSPTGPTQVYTKNKLAPFMERTPFLNLFSFLDALHFSFNQMKTSYSALPNPDIFTYGDMRIDPVICVEATFPDYVAGFVRKGANMIAIISNDAWTGKTSGYAQGSWYATPLAIEMQKPIVRCANSGVSSFIQNGHTEMLTKWQEKTVLIDEIKLNSSYSFFVKYGNIAGNISMLVAVFFILVFLLRIIKQKNSVVTGTKKHYHTKK